MYSPRPQNTFDCVKHKLAVIFLFITDGKKKVLHLLFLFEEEMELEFQMREDHCKSCTGKGDKYSTRD